MIYCHGPNETALPVANFDVDHLQVLHGDMDIYMATDFVSDVPELAHPSPRGDIEMAVVAASAAHGLRNSSYDAGGGSSANSANSTAPMLSPASKLDRTL